MNHDIDVRTYFMTRKSKTGRSAAVRERTAKVIEHNGISTMRELAEKDYEWFISLLVKKEFDDEGFNLAKDIPQEYATETHNAELLASGKVLVKSYFSEHASRAVPNGMVKRTVNAVLRLNLETMDALCEVTAEELAKIRYMGPKSLELTLQMCEKYLSENGRK